MAIIVEGGTGVAGANSYASLATLRAYALARGVTLSADDPTLEAQTIQAMDYLESFAPRFLGLRVERDQALSWPRYGVYINGFEYASTDIPPQLVDAESALVMDITAGIDLFNPALASLPIIKERVEGAVEVQYSDPSGSYVATQIRQSIRLIQQLLSAGGLFVVRA